MLKNEQFSSQLTVMRWTGGGRSGAGRGRRAERSGAKRGNGRGAAGPLLPRRLVTPCAACATCATCRRHRQHGRARPTITHPGRHAAPATAALSPLAPPPRTPPPANLPLSCRPNVLPPPHPSAPCQQTYNLKKHKQRSNPINPSTALPVRSDQVVAGARGPQGTLCVIHLPHVVYKIKYNLHT
jgi:hypothetical protein